MEDVALLINIIMALLEQEFELWGYTFSFWNILAFGCVSSTVAWAVWEIIDRS